MAFSLTVRANRSVAVFERKSRGRRSPAQGRWWRARVRRKTV